MSKIDEKSKKETKKAQQKINNFFREFYLSLKRISNYVGGISLSHFRSRSSIFWSIIYPFILIIIFGAIFGRSITPNYYTLDVLDWNESSESEEFISYLDNLTDLEVNVIEETVINPAKWLNENNKPILLVIPSLWDLHLQLETSSNITVHFDPSSSSAQNILEIIEEAVIDFNLEILPIDIKFGIVIENYFVNELKFIDSFLPGIIIVSISTLSLFTGLSYDLNERKSGIFYRLTATPTKRFEWIISKQIWQLLLAIIASSLCILFALIYDFSVSSLKPMMILFVIFGTMTFSGLAMIIIRLVPNIEAVMLVSVLISIPQILLSGALLPLDTFPSFLKYVARIFPMFYLTEGMRYLMLDFTRLQFWQYFSISGGLAISIFIIGILLTKWRKD